MAVDFSNLPLIPVWEILKCCSVCLSITLGFSAAEDAWSITETIVWREEHLVSPDFEPVAVVSGDQVLVAGMVMPLCLFCRKPALSRSLGRCPSWQHFLGASAHFQPYKWSWRRCWPCYDHGFEMELGGSKGVECACLSPKGLLKKKLFSLRECQFCKLCFYENNKGNFSHSLPSARVNCGLTGR